jgi:hypothetical protein
MKISAPLNEIIESCSKSRFLPVWHARRGTRPPTELLPRDFKPDPIQPLSAHLNHYQTNNQ